MLSTTVTVELQVDWLPLLSIAVTTTVLGPASSQVKMFWLTLVVMDANPHGSFGIDRKRIFGSTTTTPLLSKNAVRSTQPLIAGPAVSKTVTLAMQESRYPDRSTTVSMTWWIPVSAQVKNERSMYTESKLQLSKLPPLTSWAFKVYSPRLFNTTVMSWHIAVGLIVSIKVTLAIHPPRFPKLSETMISAVAPPRSTQVNTDCKSHTESTAQLSAVDKTTSERFTLIKPAGGKYRMISWQVAVGASISGMT